MSMSMSMEVESVRCECCGLEEDCTGDYIRSVKEDFSGKWLCGLCSEAVRDEFGKGERKSHEEAVKAHIAFCRRHNSNPAVRVADGMKQMLRRRSGSFSTAAEPKATTATKKNGC